MSSKVSGEELWANILFKLDDAEGKKLRYMSKQCPRGSQLYNLPVLKAILLLLLLLLSAQALQKKLISDKSTKAIN